VLGRLYRVLWVGGGVGDVSWPEENDMEEGGEEDDVCGFKGEEGLPRV
jgi:hypothetical protein